MLVNKTYRFRIYPSKEQETLIVKQSVAHVLYSIIF